MNLLNNMDKLMEQVLLKLKLLEKRFDAIEKRVGDIEKGTKKKLIIKKKSPTKSNTKSNTIPNTKF